MSEDEREGGVVTGHWLATCSSDRTGGESGIGSHGGEVFLFKPVQLPGPFYNLVVVTIDAFVPEFGELVASRLVASYVEHGNSHCAAAFGDVLGDLADVRFERRLRGEQWDKNRTFGVEAGSDAFQGVLGRLIVREEVEGGAGEVDRSVLAAQFHRLECGVVQRYLKVASGRRGPEPVEHV